MVSNEKDFYSVVTYSIKNTQLDDIEVLPGDEHIIPAGESSSYCLKKNSFLFVTRTTQQAIIEKHLNNISSNSNKVKIVKNLSENQKQEVQHDKKQNWKLLENVRQIIKRTDTPQRVNKSNADQNKEPRKKVIILVDLIVKGLNENDLSKNLNVKVQSFLGYTTEDVNLTQ